MAKYIKKHYGEWSNPTNDTSFLFYKTQDNSVSVSLTSATQSTELMHSVDGAFSETIYLYENVVKFVVDNNLPLHFLSIGLGIGYVEILICAYLLKHTITQPFQIFSFELEIDLRIFFSNFFAEKEIPHLFKESYEQILNLYSSHYELQPLELKNFIKEKIESKQIKFYEGFDLNSEIQETVYGVFFDAFSANTCPNLWTDILITKILNLCGPKAAFATYASRAHLKKALQEKGFYLEKKVGFGGKKESTFAFK